jgi:hypothetical protein
MSKPFLILLICLSTSIASAQQSDSCYNSIRLPRWGINFCLDSSWYGENSTGMNLKIGQYLEMGKRQVTIERTQNFDRSNAKQVFELAFTGVANVVRLNDTLFVDPGKEAYYALVGSQISPGAFQMAGVVNLGSYSFVFSSGYETDRSACWNFLEQFVKSTSLNEDEPFIDDTELKQNLMSNFQNVVQGNQNLNSLFLSDKKMRKLFDLHNGESPEMINNILGKVNAARAELEMDLACPKVVMENWVCQIDLLDGDRPRAYQGSFSLNCGGNRFYYQYMAAEEEEKLYIAVVTKRH